MTKNGNHGGLLVGVGASAGGLEALKTLLDCVPADSGLAFVVVQHLERHHPSILAELLGQHTAMPVMQAQEGMRPEPDHVYVIAPNGLLTLENGVLRVAHQPGDGVPRPIDVLFRSLAEDQGEHAVAIVLSGTGSDGTEGMRAIKERGGLTLAQSPETARYDGMPLCAIDAGLVDHVLSVKQMPSALLEHARHLAVSPPTAPTSLDPGIADRLAEICALLHQRTGHDFSGYKEATLLRRVRRRLLANRSASGADYLQVLAQDAEEAERLLKDLLIGVTHFFRDPAAFQALGERVIAGLVASKAAGAPIRIWVPGCASGEEMYSIAILVREQLERAGTQRGVQIFATDIDAEALADARAGRYAYEIRERVSPERLERFFVYEGAAYRAAKELREMCVLSQHSLIRDPPFSSLDLISCRNVLIYLDAELQKQLVPLFHFGLRTGGSLFLGSSESLAAHGELFETVDKKHRIFRRKEAVGRLFGQFPLGASRAVRASRVEPPKVSRTPTQQQRITAAFERMALDDYTAPCALVDEQGDILLVAGLIGRFLKLPSGPLASNLLEVLPAGLRGEVRAALRASAATRRKVVRADVAVDLDDETRRVRVIVRPLPGIEPDAGLFAVVLREQPLREAAEDDAQEARPEEPAFERFESDLQAARAQLKSIAEDFESTNEELQSSNEELLSTNEELQTSQEELQSLNEELETVNDELKHKLDELGTANSDLANLFASTAIATIFLDRHLRIAKFTPAATALFRLLESDIGRPLSDLALGFVGQDLVTDAREVLRTLEPHERQTRSADGRSWYVLRVTPYRTAENVIAGVVVTFVDISELKRAEEVEQRYGKLLDASHDAIFVWRFDAGIETWNRGAEELYGFSAEQARGQPPHRLLASEAGEPWPDVEAALREHGRWDGDVVHRAKDGRVLTVSSRLQRIVTDDGIERVLESNRDITERRQAEEGVKRSREGLRRLAEASLLVMRETRRDALLEVVAEAARRLTGARTGHGLGGAAARAPGCPPGMEFLLEEGGIYLELMEGADAIRLTEAQMRAHPRRRGLPEGHVPVRGLLGVRLLDQKGRPDGMILVTDKEQGDFTEEDEALLLQLATLASLASQHVEARLSLEEADRSKNQFLAMLSHELRNPLAPIRNSLFILGRTAPDGEQATRARSVIDRQVAHMTHLVDDLLDVTRISHGKIRLVRERLDLVDVVRRAVDDHRPAFAAAGLDVQETISDRPLPLDGDRTRVAQVISNLLSNTAKFTPRGGKVTVSVEADDVLRQGVVRVRDTGLGIAREMLPRIFEPFTQADTSLDRGRGGIGLGLSLVKGLVEMHGGTVGAESEGLGKGAELTLRFPLATGEVAGEVAAAEPNGAPSPNRYARRVLIIEDNVDAAESLREVLELCEHTVEVADSGTEGIEKARGFRPDVVLCDIGLPGMDGYAVARALRAEPALQGVTLVALTGYAGPDDIARSREAGFDVHLAKPPSIEKLEALLGSPRGPQPPSP